MAGRLPPPGRSIRSIESVIESASSTSNTSGRPAAAPSTRSPRSTRRTESPISEHARDAMLASKVFPVPALPATTTIGVSRPICRMTSPKAFCSGRPTRAPLTRGTNGFASIPSCSATLIAIPTAASPQSPVNYDTEARKPSSGVVAVTIARINPARSGPSFRRPRRTSRRTNRHLAKLDKSRTRAPVRGIIVLADREALQ